MIDDVRMLDPVLDGPWDGDVLEFDLSAVWGPEDLDDPGAGPAGLEAATVASWRDWLILSRVK